MPALIEFCPRIEKSGLPPADEAMLIFTPGNEPFNDSNTLLLGIDITGESSNFNEATAPVKSFFLEVP